MFAVVMHAVVMHVCMLWLYMKYYSYRAIYVYITAYSLRVLLSSSKPKKLYKLILFLFIVYIKLKGIFVFLINRPLGYYINSKLYSHNKRKNYLANTCNCLSKNQHSLHFLFLSFNK